MLVTKEVLDSNIFVSSGKNAFIKTLLKFGLKFVCNYVTIATKFTFLEKRPKNSIINKTSCFCLILLKF